MRNEKSRRHVIVTGGGQGLGLAITQGFLDDGANVTVIDWSSEPSADFVEVEGATVGRLNYSRADVSDESQLEAAIGDKQVTYDLARLMDGATEVSCSAFGRAMIQRM